MMPSLSEMLRINENLGGSFECSICHRRFQSQVDLFNHINLEHENILLPLASVS
jgi:C2H2-type zinc finger